jgi:hypothetical protein
VCRNLAGADFGVWMLIEIFMLLVVLVAVKFWGADRNSLTEFVWFLRASEGFGGRIPMFLMSVPDEFRRSNKWCQEPCPL